jgi:hypothetical protein
VYIWALPRASTYSSNIESLFINIKRYNNPRGDLSPVCQLSIVNYEWGLSSDGKIGPKRAIPSPQSRKPCSITTIVNTSADPSIGFIYSTFTRLIINTGFIGKPVVSESVYSSLTKHRCCLVTIPATRTQFLL